MRDGDGERALEAEISALLLGLATLADAARDACPSLPLFRPAGDGVDVLWAIIDRERGRLCREMGLPEEVASRTARRPRPVPEWFGCDDGEDDGCRETDAELYARSVIRVDFGRRKTT